MIPLTFLVLLSLAANLLLMREHGRLRRRTLRLAILARESARRVRAIDWATSAAFTQVHAMLNEGARTPEDEAPAKPEFLN
jgi:hypothetical protein